MEAERLRLAPGCSNKDFLQAGVLILSEEKRREATRLTEWDRNNIVQKLPPNDDDVALTANKPWKQVEQLCLDNPGQAPRGLGLWAAEARKLKAIAESLEPSSGTQVAQRKVEGNYLLFPRRSCLKGNSGPQVSNVEVHHHETVRWDDE